jgi:hypothetical protein
VFETQLFAPFDLCKHQQLCQSLKMAIKPHNSNGAGQGLQTQLILSTLSGCIKVVATKAITFNKHLPATSLSQP